MKSLTNKIYWQVEQQVAEQVWRQVRGGGLRCAVVPEVRRVAKDHAQLEIREGAVASAERPN